MTPIMRLKKRLYFLVAGYFRFFANFSFRRWHPRVIAITGSVGKTTMLHFVEAQLETKAHYSHNANSAFGIAFDILGLKGVTNLKLRWLFLIIITPIKSLYFRHTEQFYVVEIDGERPRETEFLASWLKPEVTLWVSLGRSHAVQFEHQVKNGEFDNLDKAITHEFAMLPQYTSQQIYIDGDSPLMVKATEKINQYNHAQTTKCFKSNLKQYLVHPDSTDFVFEKATFHFNHPLPPDVTIQLCMLNHLCQYLNIPLKTDFSNLTLPPGRNSFFEGKHGLKLIDSSYNAHMISVRSIMQMAKQLHVPHKWLVIGDIVDQGSLESSEHSELANVLAEVKPEKIILIGRRTRKYTAPHLRKLGIEPFTTNDPRVALKYLEKHTTGKETIIFKGSQYLEWIIEKLLKNPADAQKLPRREPAAVKRRLKRGLDS